MMAKEKEVTAEKDLVFDDLQACDAEHKKALHLDLIGKWIEENPY
jgi:hypothetical protein